MNEFTEELPIAISQNRNWRVFDGLTILEITRRILKRQKIFKNRKNRRRLC